MKKVAIALCLAFFLLVFWPVKYQETVSNKIQFKAYCPAVLSWTSAPYIKKQLDSLFGPIYISPTIYGCIIKKLLDEEVISESEASFRATMLLENDLFYFNNRYDLQAYFHYNSAKVGNIGALRALAELFALGKGVKTDTERAKHMFREFYSYYLPHEDIEDTCESHIDYKIGNIYNNRNAIEIEQIKWLKTLCYKSEEELYAISDWYVNDDNPYRSSVVAREIWSHMSRARDQGRTLHLYLQTPEESIILND